MLVPIPLAVPIKRGSTVVLINMFTVRSAADAGILINTWHSINTTHIDNDLNIKVLKL